MIIDITGTVLFPGNNGRNCPGNGEHPNIPCCCDEAFYADYYGTNCPHSEKMKNRKENA